MHSVLYDAAGHRRWPVTTPGFHEGRAPRNKGGLGVVYWTASQINAGSKATYTVTFKVSAHASGKVLIPAATVSFANADPNYTNNAVASTITLGSRTARVASVRQARNPLKVGNRLPALLKELTHRHRRRHRHR